MSDVEYVSVSARLKNPVVLLASGAVVTANVRVDPLALAIVVKFE